jgi:hypothetical protein
MINRTHTTIDRFMLGLVVAGMTLLGIVPLLITR